MAKKLDENVTTQRLTRKTYWLFDLIRDEKNFLILVSFLFFVSALVVPYPEIAMWVGFAIAGYSAIANDSIQTIGTFIASNSQRKWWYLWLYMGIIFIITVTYSYLVYDGDVSYQRLTSKGFATAPESFSFLQLAAPIFLLILTRLRMPVSTTFLLLSAFSTKTESILSILDKSLSGYLIAFVLAIIIWFVVAKYVNKMFKGKPAKWWLPMQWITSGALWAVWIAQDAANIAVFLPRSLGLYQFIAFTLYIFFGLGVLFYLKGDRIQSIVSEKAGVTDIRAATIIDLVYALLLYYKLFESTVPMSTTWIFIGLLGGRELAVNISKKRKSRRIKGVKKSLWMIGKDMLFALIGLLVSMILAIAINDSVRREIFSKIFE